MCVKALQKHGKMFYRINTYGKQEQCIIKIFKLQIFLQKSVHFLLNSKISYTFPNYQMIFCGRLSYFKMLKC